MNDENSRTCRCIFAVFCSMFFGSFIFMYGVSLRDSLCEYECHCTPDRCCETSELCYEYQCLCSGEANDWKNGTCEDSDYTCSDLAPFASSMIFAGIALTAMPHTLCTLSAISLVIFGICKGIFCNH